MIEKKHNLQPPGSGLPTFENAVLKNVLIPLSRLFFGWKSARVWLNRELDSIEKMVNNLSEEALNKRVLIDHIIGIEDDTRDWSVALVIEHLANVNTGIIQVIKSLSEEKPFDAPVTIPGVKPGSRTVSIAELRQITKDFESFVPQNRNSKTTKAHPWFVEFNNKDWNTFLAVHTWVHKRQIQAILKAH